MLALEEVALGRRVTHERVGREICFGQAEVGLVRGLLGVAGLEAQAVVDSRRRVRIDLQFRDVVLDVVARVAADRAVDALEAVALALHRLDEP